LFGGEVNLDMQTDRRAEAREAEIVAESAREL
jgi:hypothetical protein